MPIRFKRRAGSSGPPPSLMNGEIAVNEFDDIVWYGKGDAGSGVASSIVPIGGVGFVPNLAAVATATVITNDVATATSVYPTWVTANTGNMPQKTSSSKLSFVPSTGTLTATVFSGSGASLTNLPAANLSGTIPSAVLGNSSLFIGTTSVALNRASAALVLTGITSIDGTAAKATSLAAGATGSLVYQSAAGTTAYLAAGTNTQVLLGGASAPSWGSISNLTAGDANALAGMGPTNYVQIYNLKAGNVIAATTALHGLSGTGAGAAVDGYNPIAGDRILVKDQAVPSQNGVYVAGSGAWVRATDSDTWGELVNAVYYVTGGSTNIGKGFRCNVAPFGTLGTTNLTFVQVSGAWDIDMDSANKFKVMRSTSAGGTVTAIAVKDGLNAVDIGVENATWTGNANIRLLNVFTAASIGSDDTNGITLLLNNLNTNDGGTSYQAKVTGQPSAIVLSTNGVAFYHDATSRSPGANATIPVVAIVTSAAFRPGTDNTINLGAAAQRWKEVFAGIGTINTSDERHKTEIQSVTDQVLDAWADVEYFQYKMQDAVQAKGDSARIHFGVVAQRVKAAFEQHGLDPFAYGVLCYDTWEESKVDGPHGGTVTPAGDIYGIRYDEAHALECALMRRTTKRMQEQLDALNQRLST